MKYALIIGNDQYSDPKLAKLKTPAADSQALANVLSDSNFGAFDEVIPVINQTVMQVRREISRFLNNKKPEDQVLVYFSGHGVLDDRGRLFLTVRDTEVNLLKATAIPSSFVTDELDSCRSKKQILILDCCYSGAHARGAKGELKAITEATFEGHGRVVLTASSETQLALEGNQVSDQLELSLFTHYLLEGITTGQADIDNDGVIMLDEWYDYTYKQVTSQTTQQTPTRWVYKQEGDLVISQNPFFMKKVTELPIELVQALESDFVGLRLNAVDELGKLLKSRDPKIVELAHKRLEVIKETDDSRKVTSAAVQILSDFDALAEKKPLPEQGPTKPEPQEDEYKKLERQADAREMKGDRWGALLIWYKIKRKGFDLRRIEAKIKQLKKEIFLRLAIQITLLVIFTIVIVFAVLGLNNPPASLSDSSPTPTPLITFTATNSFTPTPSLTLIPTMPILTHSPTPLPVAATVSNCRSGTGTDFERVVQIPQGETFDVNGRNDQSDYLYIKYGKYECWILAELVIFTVDLTAVPTVITPTPLPPPPGPGDVRTFNVSAPGEVTCSLGGGCPVNVIVRNAPPGNVCVYVQPQEVPGQNYWFQFSGTSGRANIGDAPDGTPFVIFAVSRSSCPGGQQTSLPSGTSARPATVIRHNE